MSNNIQNIVEKRNSCDAHDDASHGNESDALNEIASLKLKELKPEIGSKDDALGEIVFEEIKGIELGRVTKAYKLLQGKLQLEVSSTSHSMHDQMSNIKTFCDGNSITKKISKVQYGYEQQELHWKSK